MFDLWIFALRVPPSFRVALSGSRGPQDDPRKDMCGQHLQHSNHVLSWRVSLCIVFINQVASSWSNIVLTLGIMRSNVDITQGIVYKSMTNICPSLGRRSDEHKLRSTSVGLEWRRKYFVVGSKEETNVKRYQAS